MGPSLQLDTLRHVPDTATCVTFAFTGNVQGLKGLFSQGLASPKDISSTRGYSLLRWALYGQQYEMCKYLMTAGADPSYCPKAWTDDSPREKAFDTILRGGLQSEAMDILRVIAQGRDYDEYIEKQNFSRLHKIGKTVCARLLLEAGAFPNPPLPKGMKTGNPLNCAAPNAADPMLLKTLLDFGAEIESTGLDGMTPLLGVARGNSAAHAAVLLDYGANICAVSRSGKTPLSAAIEYNNYGVLRLLLAKCKALLEIIARYADIKTIGILLTDSSVSLGAILSSLGRKQRGSLETDIIPGMEHFRNMLAARAAEFSDASKGTGMSDSPLEDKVALNLEKLVRNFEELLANLTELQSPPSYAYQGEKEKDLKNTSIESKMESGLLVHGQDDDDDDLLVFEDAQEHLVNVY